MYWLRTRPVLETKFSPHQKQKPGSLYLSLTGYGSPRDLGCCRYLYVVFYWPCDHFQYRVNHYQRVTYCVHHHCWEIDYAHHQAPFLVEVTSTESVTLLRFPSLNHVDEPRATHNQSPIKIHPHLIELTMWLFTPTLCIKLSPPFSQPFYWILCDGLHKSIRWRLLLKMNFSKKTKTKREAPIRTSSNLLAHRNLSSFDLRPIYITTQKRPRKIQLCSSGSNAKNKTRFHQLKPGK